MIKNQVMLFKRLVNFEDCNQDNLPEVMSIQIELMKYGFVLDKNAFEQLKKTDIANIIEFQQEVINFIKEFLGGSRNFTSLYGNFPNDVMSVTDAQAEAQLATFKGQDPEFFASIELEKIDQLLG